MCARPQCPQPSACKVEEQAELCRGCPPALAEIMTSKYGPLFLSMPCADADRFVLDCIQSNKPTGDVVSAGHFEQIKQARRCAAAPAA